MRPSDRACRSLREDADCGAASASAVFERPDQLEQWLPFPLKGVPLPLTSSRLFGNRRGSLAVDLGTANTVVFVKGEGIVLFEPSVIAINEDTTEVLAAGTQAKEMIGRTPGSIRAMRPLRHGVISDFEVTEKMLHYFIGKAIGKRRGRPSVVLCVPSGLTGVERDAVQDAALVAGAAEVSLIEEAMAAAIGADLPVAEPVGSMVVDTVAERPRWQSHRLEDSSLRNPFVWAATRWTKQSSGM